MTVTLFPNRNIDISDQPCIMDPRSVSRPTANDRNVLLGATIVNLSVEAQRRPEAPFQEQVIIAKALSVEPLARALDAGAGVDAAAEWAF